MSCQYQQSLLFDNFSYCAVENSCGGGRMSLAYKTKTDLIHYSGNNLSCTPIQKCDVVSDVFEVFNDEICPEALTLKIINTFIENSSLSTILCNTILKKCVTCDYMKDCVTCDTILECTTTTTTTVCPCFTLSNSAEFTIGVYYTPCSPFDFGYVPVPPGVDTVSVCAKSINPDSTGKITWTVGNECYNIGGNGRYTCSESCCEYTVTKETGYEVYIDFLNCFGYPDYREMSSSDTSVTFCSIEDQLYIGGGDYTLTKNDCNCQPTCECYEIDTTGGGNYLVRWKGCDGSDNFQSIYNEIYYVCAIPTTVTYSGTGPVSFVESHTPCVYTPDCWESFSFNVSNMDALSFIINSTGKFSIEWEPGVIDYYNISGSFTRSHTYTAPYTGVVTISSPDLSRIKSFITNASSFIPAPLRGVTIVGTELQKLVGLITLNVGFSLDIELYCTTSQLPSTLTSISIYKGDLSGDLQFLPSGATFLNVLGTSMTGNINQLPVGLTTCVIGGTNAVSGSLSTLPTAYQTNMTRFEVYGSNTISGDVTSDFALYSVIEIIRIEGSNTITGNISGISTLTTLEQFTIYGLNNLSGNLSSLIPLTSLTRFAVDNDDMVLSPGVVGNTITGNIDDIPSSVTAFILGGFNTVSGTLSTIPSGMLNFNVRGVPVVSGNTISGNLSSLTTSAITTFYITGENTISGDIDDLPSTLRTVVIASTLNSVFGDLADLPTGVRLVTLQYGTGVFTYTSGRSWASDMESFTVASQTALSTPDVDEVVIDLAATSWITGGSLTLRGTNSGSPAVIAAINTLTATPTPNVTVTFI